MPWIKSCLCQHEKKKTPTISPPIHLLLKVRRIYRIKAQPKFSPKFTNIAKVTLTLNCYDQQGVKVKRENNNKNYQFCIGKV